jgi:hypothetical protein
MTAAIFGLVGVMVGGVISGVVAAYAARRVARADARVACRLLERELRGAAEGMLRWIADGSTAHPDRTKVLLFPAWKQHHAVAARALSDAAWNPISDTYLAIYDIRTRDEFAADLDDDTMERLTEVAASAGAGADSLRAARADLTQRRSWFGSRSGATSGV